MYFFDYGNAFLLEARRAGADVSKKGQVRACTSWSSLQQPAESALVTLVFHRLRAHHYSATQAMCKTSWEIYSLWALDHSGDQVVIVEIPRKL